ncbi:cysteine--tRNA ligase [Nonomuraea sp. NPDC048916]|uniref:CysS/YqeB C-terminal domain-containing protein n=1 Tax=Nonomuraea sp. NPDC048916 TaxID=3154232 RepID=UPI003404DD17
MLRIYDTRTRQTEEIAPARALRMHTCGPTVHRRAHLGDLRSYLLSDLIRRVLERRRVRMVVCRDITDVGHLAGDAKAPGGGIPGRPEGRSMTEIARHYEDSFERDTAALNIRPPEHAPRASETIEPMVELIAKLVEQGNAYTVPDGSVFFDAATFPTYGEISGNRLDTLEPGHRHGDADPRKRRHADWALWKPADGEPAWDTPWGRGVPGRHIGCSAMSLRFLGERVDIHTGTVDLRFPHHEDQRAQSDSAAGHEVVKHWVHGEHLLFDGREMAGPAGDVVLLSDVAEAGLDPLAVRLAFMEQRYRRQARLDWDTLRAADRTLRRWRGRVAEWSESPSAPMAADYVERAEAAFDDDLDTPAALRVLGDLERDESVPPGSKFESFLHLDRVLALDLSTEIGRTPVLPPGAAELLAQRARARDSHDWPAADRLSAALADVGVLVSDTADGQVWVLAGR